MPRIPKRKGQFNIGAFIINIGSSGSIILYCNYNREPPKWYWYLGPYSTQNYFVQLWICRDTRMPSCLIDECRTTYLSCVQQCSTLMYRPSGAQYHFHVESSFLLCVALFLKVASRPSSMAHHGSTCMCMFRKEHMTSYTVPTDQSTSAKQLNICWPKQQITSKQRKIMSSRPEMP